MYSLPRKAVFILAVLALAVLVGTGLSPKAADLPAAQRSAPSHWAAGPSLLVARAGACSAQLPDGRSIVTGGAGADGALASVEVLGLQGRFTAASPMLSARQDHLCVALASGMVLIAGGTGPGGATNAAELYAPSADQWTAMGGMTSARVRATATLLKDGRVLVAGGTVGGAANNTLEIFDPKTNAFAGVTGTLSSPRQSHAAAALRDGRVLIAGGTDGNNALATVDIFDPATNKVSPAFHLSTPRMGLSATTLLTGDVLFAGGNDGAKDLITAEVYNARTGTLGAPIQMGSARSGHTAISLPNNNTILIAGGTSAGVALTATELYVPWQGQFKPAGTLAQARTGATAMPLTRTAGMAGRSSKAKSGTLLVAGGDTGGDSTDSTEDVTYPTLTSDQTNYLPGDTITLTGTGWAPNEVVTMTLTVDPATHDPVTLTSTADANGNFANSDYVDQPSDLGVTFYVTATGATGDTAGLLTFTDSCTAGDCYTASVAPATSVINVATSFTVTFTYPSSDTSNLGRVYITVPSSYGTVSCGTVTVTGTFTNGTTSGTNWTCSVASNVVSVVSSSNSTDDLEAGHAGTVVFGVNATGTTAGSGLSWVTGGSASHDSPYGTAFGNSSTDPTTAITATAPTLTSISPTSATYGDPATGITATGTNFVNGTSVINFNGTALTTTCSGATSCTATIPIANLKVTPGTFNVYVANGSSNSPNQTFTLNKKTLTLTGLTVSAQVYNGTTTATLSGTAALQALEADGTTGNSTDGKPITGDTVSLSGTAVGTFASKNVGTGVAVTVSGNTLGGTSVGNYVLATNEQSGLSANITVKTLTVTGLTVSAKPYDATTTATLGGTAALQTAEAAGSGTTSDGKPYTGDTVSLSGAAAGTFAQAGVGTAIAVTVSGNTLGGAQATNYVLATNEQSGLSANITTRPVTYTAAASTKPYDATTTSSSTPTLTSGTLATGTTVISATESYDNASVGSTHVMTPLVTLSDPGDYTITEATIATGIITKRLVTYTAAASTKPYDATTTSSSTPTLTSGTLATGTTVVSATESYDTASVGNTHVMTPLVTLSDPGDYTITEATIATGIITTRPVTYTAAASTKPYDATTTSSSTPTLTSGTLATGTTVVSATESYDNASVGSTHVMTPLVTLSDPGDYTITEATIATGIITTRPVTYTAAASTKPYDATTTSSSTPTLTSGTLATGTTVVSATESYDTASVGNTHVMTPLVTLSDPGDYTITEATFANGIITTRAVTYTAAASTKPYDATTSSSSTPTITSGSLATGTTVVSATESYDNASVGSTHVMTPLVTLSDPGDYTITEATIANGIITTRAVTYTAAASTKPYDTTTTSSSIPTITSGSLAAGTTVVSATESYDNASVGSTHVMTPLVTLSDPGDYTITEATIATGIITTRPVTYTAAASTKPYDATTTSSSTPTLTSGTLAPGTTVVTATESYDNASAGSTHVMTPLVTLSDPGDYTITEATIATGIITTRPVTYTATASSKPYDATTGSSSAPTLTSGTLATGTTVVSATESYDTASVGSNHVMTPLVALSDPGDYTITEATIANGVITTRPVTYTAAPSSKPWDGNTTSGSIPTITGGSLATGTTVTSASESYDNASVGSNHVMTPLVTLSDGSDYTITEATINTGVIAAVNSTFSFNLTGLHNFYGSPAFNINTSPYVTSNSSGAVTFTLGSGPCSVSLGGTVTMTGAGICTINASQAASGNYNAAGPVSGSFMIDSTLLATGSSTKVALSWNIYSGATGYAVYQSGPFVGVQTAASCATQSYTAVSTPTANSYIATSLTNNSYYCYYVTATGPGLTGATQSKFAAAKPAGLSLP